MQVAVNVPHASAACSQYDDNSSDELLSDFSDVETSDYEQYSDEQSDRDHGANADGSGWRAWQAGDNDFPHYPFRLIAQNVGPHFSSQPMNLNASRIC